MQLKEMDKAIIKQEVKCKNEPISAVWISHRTNNKERGGKRSSNNMENGKHNNRLKASNSVCFACGKEYPRKGICPAKGKKCNVCNRWNHFAKTRFCKVRGVNTIKERD